MSPPPGGIAVTGSWEKDTKREKRKNENVKEKE
jgi:hypothetical protein